MVISNLNNQMKNKQKTINLVVIRIVEINNEETGENKSGTNF